MTFSRANSTVAHLMGNDCPGEWLSPALVVYLLHLIKCFKTLFPFVSLRNYLKTEDLQEVCWSEAEDKSAIKRLGRNWTKPRLQDKTLGKPNRRAQWEIKEEMGENNKLGRMIHIQTSEYVDFAILTFTASCLSSLMHLYFAQTSFIWSFEGHSWAFNKNVR